MLRCSRSLTRPFRQGGSIIRNRRWLVGLPTSSSRRASNTRVRCHRRTRPFSLSRCMGRSAGSGKQTWPINHRDLQYDLIALSMWTDLADTQRNVDWTARCSRYPQHAMGSRKVDVPICCTGVVAAACTQGKRTQHGVEEQGAKLWESRATVGLARLRRARSPRPSRAGLRLVHRGVRDRRSEGGKDATRRAYVN
jgi:hypothetical protein